MRVVFMGTPDFAVGALEAIVKAGHEVVLVVTQPDKQKGRGKEVQFPPVKECAIQYNIPVFQPVKIKTEESVETLREYPADVFVVAAFGQILSKEILDMPKYGCLNIHASLLPKYRGAAPIQWVILDGEKTTGVTIMQMNEGLDTGDMLLKEEIPIDSKETGESLHDKLAVVGADLIVKALPLLEQGKLTAEPQNDQDSCYAKMLKKDMGHMDWEKEAVVLERLIRGLNSWPSAYTYWNKKTLKIWEAFVEPMTGTPGEILQVNKDSIVVGCGKDSLRITALQLEGKKRMAVKDFLLGYKLQPGMLLGKSES